MAYYTDLFSPRTYDIFSKTDKKITGFRRNQEKTAKRLHKGDKLICYMTKFSRWVGVLEIQEGPFIDNTPIYYEENDPFIVRFKVSIISWPELDKTLPIHDKEIWENLSFTKNLNQNSSRWTGKVRGNLTKLNNEDGQFLETKLKEQERNGKIFRIDREKYNKFLTHRVRSEKEDVTVIIPDNKQEIFESEKIEHTRDSIKIQALLAEIGSKMGLKIWIPKADRSRVLSEWNDKNNMLIDRLPLNYDETTLKTIEQIDVLWLKRRSIKRAFEVEHTTSIYSGILRMADLLALQPNMDIKLYIVAPDSRKEKVFQELQRPVFSLLEKGPLYESCKYLSYESIKEIANLPHITHVADDILDEFSESAED